MSPTIPMPTVTALDPLVSVFLTKRGVPVIDAAGAEGFAIPAGAVGAWFLVCCGVWVGSWVPVVVVG